MKNVQGSGEDTIEKESNASPVSLGIIHLVRTQNV